MTKTKNAIDQALRALRETALAVPEIAAEFSQARTEFGAGYGDPAFETRLTEWFLLERHSPFLKGAPVERLLVAWAERVEQEFGLPSVVLLTSFSGLFEVSEVRPGEGVWLRDLAGFGEYPLDEPEGSNALERGDLIVGRLFPLPDARYQVSAGAGVFRDDKVRAALVRDLEAARAGGSSKVLRVAQLDLEQMFWGSRKAPTVEPAATIADARAYLIDHGVAFERGDQIMAELGRTPFDRDQLVPGAGDALGAILDQLAFETEIDLDEARARLIAAWQALAAPDDASSSEPPEKADAVQRFVDGLRRGEDLDQLFSTVQEDLALGDLDAAEEGSPAPDFPGVVSAMIAEFEWEVGRERPTEQLAHFAQLQIFGEFAHEIGVFEELSSADLLRFAAFWIHEQRALKDAAAARDLCRALEEFCRWTEENHEIELWTPFAEAFRGIAQSLPRLVELNASLERSDALGELFCFERDSDGVALLDRKGNEHRAIELPAAVAAALKPGEYLRAEIGMTGAVNVYCIYPAEARGLLER